VQTRNRFITILKGSHLNAMKMWHPFRVRVSALGGPPGRNDPRVGGGRLITILKGSNLELDEDVAPLQGAGFSAIGGPRVVMTRG
jgi:hypothetical protein